MRGTEYSPYKAVYHIDALKRRLPVKAIWAITGVCNLNCPGCITKYGDGLPQYEWDLDEAVGLARELKKIGVKAINLTGGEPTLHSQFNWLVKTLLELDFDLGLITNGTRLEHVSHELLKKFKYIRFSLDALDGEAYHRFHGGYIAGTFPNITDSIKELKSAGCVIGASFVVSSDNIHEIVSFAEWAKAVGFSNCRFTYMWTPDGVHYELEERGNIWTAMQRAKKLEESDFAVFTMSERMALYKRQYIHCYSTDLSMYILPDKTVWRCCPLRAIGQGYYGRLDKQSLFDVWSSRPEQDVSKCPACWEHKKNEFMSYLMEENPRHVNFV